MLRSDLNPFRALVVAATVIVLAAGVARATETATTTGETKKATTALSKPATTTTTATTTTKSTTTSTSADAKRAAAKKQQHAPVMTTANATKLQEGYPWTQKNVPAKTTVSTTASATFKDAKGAGSSTSAVHSPSYSMTVTAPRAATPKATAAKPSTVTATKPVATTTTATTKPATTVATKPATTTARPTAATFSERMAKTTVTPPALSSGAKATNTTTRANTTTKAAVTAPKVATAAPKSPPRGAKPGWFFRQVVASSSSSAKSAGTVALAEKPVTPATVAQAKPATPATVAQAKPTTPAKVAQAKPAAQPSTAVAASLDNPKAANPKAPLTTSVQSLGAAFMEQREQYVYNSLNRRDPFASLVSGSFEGEVGTPLLDVSSMKLVGIVWGTSDKFALVEDGHGHGFVLRVGDPVLNGYVAGLTKQELIVKQSSYGDTQTVTIQLQRKEGASNE